MTSLQEDAQHALAAKLQAQASLAEIAKCPPWRHAVFAGLMAGLVLTPALPVAVRFAVIFGALMAIALIVQSDRRRLGVFVNGYRRGKTQLVVFPLLAVFMAVYLTSVYAGLELHRPEVSVALAVVMFGVAWAGSILWQRVFERELRG